MELNSNLRFSCWRWTGNNYAVCSGLYNNYYISRHGTKLILRWLSPRYLSGHKRTTRVGYDGFVQRIVILKTSRLLIIIFFASYLISVLTRCWKASRDWESCTTKLDRQKSYMRWAIIATIVWHDFFRIPISFQHTPAEVSPVHFEHLNLRAFHEQSPLIF